MVAGLAASPATARVLLTQDEALRDAFGDAEVTRVADVLDDGQLEAVERLAGSRPESKLVVRHEARRGGRLVGIAWFDAHVVRTHPEVLMIVVTPDGRVERIEVLAFHEPIDYVAPERWLDQFEGEPLSDDLTLKRAIRPMTGASLTARSVTAAVRRALALQRILTPAEGDDSSSAATEDGSDAAR